MKGVNKRFLANAPRNAAVIVSSTYFVIALVYTFISVMSDISLFHFINIRGLLSSIILGYSAGFLYYLFSHHQRVKYLPAFYGFLIYLGIVALLVADNGAGDEWGYGIFLFTLPSSLIIMFIDDLLPIRLIELIDSYTYKALFTGVTNTLLIFTIYSLVINVFEKVRRR